MQGGSLFSTPSPAFIACRLLDRSHSDWCEMVPHSGFDLHFSDNEWCSPLFFFSSRKWQLTPVFLPGESHGQRSLPGHSPWDHKESDTTVSEDREWSSTYSRCSVNVRIFPLVAHCPCFMVLIFFSFLWNYWNVFLFKVYAFLHSSFICVAFILLALVFYDLWVRSRWSLPAWLKVHSW